MLQVPPELLDLRGLQETRVLLALLEQRDPSEPLVRLGRKVIRVFRVSQVRLVLPVQQAQLDPQGLRVLLEQRVQPEHRAVVTSPVRGMAEQLTQPLISSLTKVRPG